MKIKRDYGIKARHMAQLEEEKQSDPKEAKPKYGFVVISDKPGRLTGFLQVLLARKGKTFDFRGFDLYREASSFAETSQGQQTVALILTDGPEDRTQRTEKNLERWKETLLAFSGNYFEHFIDDIAEERLPVTFTVVLLFHEKYGKLSQQELEEIEKEVANLQQEGQKLDLNSCHSEEEVAGVVEKKVVNQILARHQVQSKMKQSAKTREQRIAKATKATREATLRPGAK
ncbi:MAG: hypothetical protein DRQ24_10605 [Candidatus Latescibacterota bacterium]|nr:MAG: hypothetical protein DRQ24_10605 [Candidatus Latescibacterota bacterium]